MADEKPKRTRRKTAVRNRGPKTKPKTEEKDAPATESGDLSQDLEDLPDQEYDEDGGGDGHEAKILRSEICWSRDKEGNIKKDKRGTQMRTWEVDVAFAFAADFEDGVKTVKYPVSKAKNSDYARFRAVLKEMGWNLKSVGEIEGQLFTWMGEQRDFENKAGEKIEWVQWFPTEFHLPTEA